MLQSYNFAAGCVHVVHYLLCTVPLCPVWKFQYKIHRSNSRTVSGWTDLSLMSSILRNQGFCIRDVLEPFRGWRKCYWAVSAGCNFFFSTQIALPDNEHAQHTEELQCTITAFRFEQNWHRVNSCAAALCLCVNCLSRCAVVVLFPHSELPQNLQFRFVVTFWLIWHAYFDWWIVQHSVRTVPICTLTTRCIVSKVYDGWWM